MKSSKILRSAVTDNYLIGNAIEKFDGKRLPTKIEVLRRLLDCNKYSIKDKNEAFKLIYEELRSIWESINIKIKAKISIVSKLENLWAEYKRLHKSAGRKTSKIKEENFLENMNSLFDISVENFVTDGSLGNDEAKKFYLDQKGDRKLCLGSIKKSFPKIGKNIVINFIHFI